MCYQSQLIDSSRRYEEGLEAANVVVTGSEESNVFLVPLHLELGGFERVVLPGSVVEVQLVGPSRQADGVFVNLVLGGVELQDSCAAPSTVVDSANARLTLVNSPASDLAMIVAPFAILRQLYRFRSDVAGENVRAADCVFRLSIAIN